METIETKINSKYIVDLTRKVLFNSHCFVLWCFTITEVLSRTTRKLIPWRKNLYWIRNKSIPIHRTTCRLASALLDSSSLICRGHKLVRSEGFFLPQINRRDEEKMKETITAYLLQQNVLLALELDIYCWRITGIGQRSQWSRSLKERSVFEIVRWRGKRNLKRLCIFLRTALVIIIRVNRLKWNIYLIKE